QIVGLLDQLGRTRREKDSGACCGLTGQFHQVSLEAPAPPHRGVLLPLQQSRSGIGDVPNGAHPAANTQRSPLRRADCSLGSEIVTVSARGDAAGAEGCTGPSRGRALLGFILSFASAGVASSLRSTASKAPFSTLTSFISVE